MICRVQGACLQSGMQAHVDEDMYLESCVVLNHYGRRVEDIWFCRFLGIWVKTSKQPRFVVKEKEMVFWLEFWGVVVLVFLCVLIWVLEVWAFWIA